MTTIAALRQKEERARRAWEASADETKPTYNARKRPLLHEKYVRSQAARIQAEHVAAGRASHPSTHGKPHEIHRGAFHLVHSIPNQQWWITFGSGGPSSWSILSKWPSFAEAHTQWKRIHNESTSSPASRKKRRVLTIRAPKSPLGL
jgi:hypothetical protein